MSESFDPREYLCWYDPRHPDFTGEEDKPENCCCDNCFYGKHKLADALLQAQADLEAAQFLLSESGRDELIRRYEEHGEPDV